jgi:hypothetical protein
MTGSVVPLGRKESFRFVRREMDNNAGVDDTDKAR